MKLSEMRDLITRHDLQLTKSLGQNFLHDGNQLRRIAAAAKLSKTDRVLEIGPGLGPLTELLTAEAGEVLAIEKDHRLYDFLKTRFALAVNPSGSSRRKEALTKNPAPQSHLGSPLRAIPAPNLTLIHDDALLFLRREQRDWHDWKLVANLPYSVASPLLVDLAQAERPPQMMVATLQQEVARRIVARADDDDYGILSLLVQLRYEPGELLKIPRDCFFPAPDVDSACISLTRRDTPLLPPDSRPIFVRLVKLAFSQRRKMMFKLLKAAWLEERLIAAFAAAGLPHTIRAEKVSLEQFAILTRSLN